MSPSDDDVVSTSPPAGMEAVLVPGTRHSFVRTRRGARIHVAEQGEGPLVLLVHGFPELWYSWRAQLPALAAAGYRAVAFDQRGYGRSSKFWNPEAYRISRLVEDAVDLVLALGESEAVIVGHDWGAPVAWTAAWRHPDVFRAVVGMGVPFSGRGLIALPGCPFGEVRPRDLHPAIAGEGQIFYQDYFGALGEIIDEIETDVRGWFRDIVFSVSGDSPTVSALAGADLASLDVVELVRASPTCIPHGARMRDRFDSPQRLPAWLDEHALDAYVREYERTGFAGPLSYYRMLDAGWEELADMEGRPVRVPALYLTGELDIARIWAPEAIARAREHVPELVGPVVLPRCGHWTQQERAEETNVELVRFLGQL